MTTQQQVNWRGMHVVDPSGSRVGTLDEVYLDGETDQPEWAAVKTGMFGSRMSLVPLAGATSDGQEVRVAHERDQIKKAPNVDANQDLSLQDEEKLYGHYGVNYAKAAASDPPPTQGAGGSADRDDAMTRSEEELHVGKSTRIAGHARLRKYVETEHATTTVPLQHETARVSREPITDANRERAMAGPQITSAEHEVTLMAEEPVVEKRTVAKERVGLEKETVSEDRAISEDLRKERIETTGDVKR